MRGFKSAVDLRLHFGLGNVNLIDSIHIQWPDGSCTQLYDVQANQFLELKQSPADPCKVPHPFGPGKVFRPFPTPVGLNHFHRENEFNDFLRDPLLFHMNSNEGPRTAVGDVNDDGLDDLYICGAKGEAGALYIQHNKGGFQTSNTALFESESSSEESDCAFFDATGTGIWTFM